MAGISPTQNTLKKLRKDGYMPAVVEYWQPFAKKRKDLYGFIDVIAVGTKGTLAVQATSLSNMSARIHKIREDKKEALKNVLAAGWRVEVWGWYKKANRWQVKITIIDSWVDEG